MKAQKIRKIQPQIDMLADHEWCRANAAQLVAKYTGHFIMVVNKEVLAAARTEKTLLNKAWALGFQKWDHFLVMSIGVRKRPKRPLEV